MPPLSALSSGGKHIPCNMLSVWATLLIESGGNLHRFGKGLALQDSSIDGTRSFSRRSFQCQRPWS